MDDTQTKKNSTTRQHTHADVTTTMKRRIVPQHPPPYEENDFYKQQPVVVDSSKKTKRCKVHKDENQEQCSSWKGKSSYRGFSLQSLKQVEGRKAFLHDDDNNNSHNNNTYPKEDADDDDADDSADDEAIPPSSTPRVSNQPNLQLEVVDPETTAQEFYHRYVALRKPCVVSGLPRRRRRHAPDILHQHHHPTETAKGGISPSVTPTSSTMAAKIPSITSSVVSLSCHDLVKFAGQEVGCNAAPTHSTQYSRVWKKLGFFETMYLLQPFMLRRLCFQFRPGMSHFCLTSFFFLLIGFWRSCGPDWLFVCSCMCACMWV
jgi:hypothetical protein